MLHQRKFSEPPTPLRVDAGQNGLLSPSVKSRHRAGLALQIPQPRTNQQLEHPSPSAEKAHLPSTSTKPGTSHPPLELRPRSTVHLPSRGRQPRPGSKSTAHIRLDHKRKHAYYSQDEHRQYPPALSEDILHMSEVAADDGIKACGRDIFGERGASGVFDLVRFPSIFSTQTRGLWICS